MFPTGTRSDELRPLLPFFEPRRGLSRATGGCPARWYRDAWTGTFRGGTRISTASP